MGNKVSEVKNLGFRKVVFGQLDICFVEVVKYLFNIA